jgi:predicted kinase
MVEAHVRRGLDIIVDGTHTTHSSVHPYATLAKKHSYHFGFLLVRTPLETCLSRRVPNGFPEPVLWRMHNQLKNFEEERYFRDYPELYLGRGVWGSDPVPLIERKLGIEMLP